MTLRSDSMNLSSDERGWLPWFGATGKLRMGWSCFLNRQQYATNEEIFESIAKTRREALINWANGKWAFLEGLAARLEGSEHDSIGRCRHRQHESARNGEHSGDHHMQR